MKKITYDFMLECIMRAGIGQKQYSYADQYNRGFARRASEVERIVLSEYDVPYKRYKKAFFANWSDAIELR